MASCLSIKSYAVMLTQLSRFILCKSSALTASNKTVNKTDRVREVRKRNLRHSVEPTDAEHVLFMYAAFFYCNRKRYNFVKTIDKDIYCACFST